LIVRPSETTVREINLTDADILDSLIESISKVRVEEAVAFISSTTNQVKIAQQDPGSANQGFGVADALEELR
jgi:hypothetical protein